MKNKLHKIVFAVSFIPYIYILGVVLWNSVIGTTFIFSEIRGFEAFSITVLVYAYILSLHIPVIPLCLIYDIIYIFRRRIFRSRDDIWFSNVFVPRFAAASAGLFCIICIIARCL